MKIKISKTVENLAPSGIRAFFDLVLNMKDVISLGVGEPDFVTPWHIREKAVYAIEEGFTSYTSNKGMPELRKEIAHFLKKRYGLKYDWDEEILITVGVSEGVDLAFRALLNPGDKVLIPLPCYVSYGPVVEMAGGKPVYIRTELKNKFKLKASDIDKAYKKGTRALMLNYPANPTGASYTKKELREIAKVVIKRNMIVISDEVYDELTYDYDHTPFASIPGMKERVVYLNGFSKAYAMTGFRLGWVCGPKEVVAAMTKIHQYTILCASVISQMAAINALRNGMRDVQNMKKEYQRRRRYVVTTLNELGLDCHNPDGAFYVFPSIKKTGLSSLQFAEDLLKKENVALVPGVAFGSCAEGHVRISYASSYENIKEALVRIRSFLER